MDLTPGSPSARARRVSVQRAPACGAECGTEAEALIRVGAIDVKSAGMLRGVRAVSRSSHEPRARSRKRAERAVLPRGAPMRRDGQEEDDPSRGRRQSRGALIDGSGPESRNPRRRRGRRSNIKRGRPVGEGGTRENRGKGRIAPSWRPRTASSRRRVVVVVVAQPAHEDEVEAGRPRTGRPRVAMVSPGHRRRSSMVHVPGRAAVVEPKLRQRNYFRLWRTGGSIVAEG